jgi:large subunit ribosomal protein L33
MIYYIYLGKKGLIFLCSFLREAKFTAISEVPLMRVKVTLACTECKQRNYNTMKNKKNDPERLEMKKHCRFCNKHTLHKETK